MAPSGSGHYSLTTDDDVMTLDITGVGGDSPYIYKDPYGINDKLANCSMTSNDYFCKFGGTSASTPQVAGIIGLILSRRSDFQDLSYFGGSKAYRTFTLIDIIKKSAVDQTGNPLEDLSGVDIYHGFGLANAYRALLSVIRGDVDNSGEIDISDIIYMRDFMFYSGPPPQPDIRTADCDCIDGVDIADMTYLVDYQFRSGPAPVTPCYSF